MTTIAWPEFSMAPQRVEWTLTSPTLDTVSPLDGTTQTQELAGAVWGLVVEYKFITEADANKMKAFLLKMRGRSGRVLLHNLERARPQGTASGSPLVAGAGQTGTALAIDGLAAGATLLAGDMVGIPGQLFMVVADATADGTGAVTLTIEPPIRTAPADNAAVTLLKPTCSMRLTEDLARWSPRVTMGTQRIHEFALQFAESLAP